MAGAGKDCCVEALSEEQLDLKKIVSRIMLGIFLGLKARKLSLVDERVALNARHEVCLWDLGIEVDEA